MDQKTYGTGNKDFKLKITSKKKDTKLNNVLKEALDCFERISNNGINDKNGNNNNNNSNVNNDSCNILTLGETLGCYLASMNDKVPPAEFSTIIQIFTMDRHRYLLEKQYKEMKRNGKSNEAIWRWLCVLCDEISCQIE